MKTINGLQLHKMIVNGFNNLKNFEDFINSINVFPVSDSDTGTNMVLTLTSALENTKEDIHVGDYLSNLSKNMLLGARGNSGVIFSQMAKGISSSISSSEISVKDLSNALLEGYKKAYNATIDPKEGTILSVSHAGILNTINKLNSDSFLEFFKIYLDELLAEEATTIEKLDILKENGVLDAGGYAYYKFIEGMYFSLKGIDIKVKSEPILKGKEGSIFLQLKDFFNFDIYTFTEVLKGFSSKIKVFSYDSLLEITVEEVNINNLINYIKSFGAVVSIPSKEEVTNLRRYDDKSLYIVAFSSSSCYDKLFESYGVDIIFRTKDVCTKEVVDTFKFILSNRMVIFTNGKKNSEITKEAIKELDIQDRVTIIETNDEVECYFSLVMDIVDNSIEERISSFVNEAKEVNIVKVNKEEGTDPISIIIDKLEKVEDINDKSAFLVILNKEMYQYHLDEVSETLQDKFPYIEIDYKEDDSIDTLLKIGEF